MFSKSHKIETTPNSYQRYDGEIIYGVFINGLLPSNQNEWLNQHVNVDESLKCKGEQRT